MIHTSHNESPLSSRDHVPSLKSAHQDPSTITCKTKKNKLKIKKQENKFFGALETPCLQQFNHKAKLGFSAFIH
jgi:hypothetical protein